MLKLGKNLKAIISKRLFFKEYFLKYFIIFYILIVLTSLTSSSVIFYLSNKSIENEIHNRNYILLNDLISSIDDKYQGIVNELMYFEVQDTTRKFSNEINIDSKFHYSPNLKVLSSLGSIKAKYTGIKDVILFFRKNNYLFSPDGMTYFESYFKNVLLIDDSQINTTKSRLTSIEHINVENIASISGNEASDEEKNGKADQIIMSIPLTSYKNLGITVSLILDSSFFSFFVNNYDYKKINSSLIIINSNGEQLISIGENILGKKDIQNNMDKINNGLKEFRIKTSKGFASVTIGKSDLNKWTYITAVPYTYITSQTRYIKNIMLYMMLLFMVLGFAAAYKLGNWQYRPIEVLTNYTRSILNSSENNSNDSFIEDGIRGNFCRPKKEVKRTNEFAYVKQSIDYLQSLNINMKRFIDESMPVLKQNVIYKVLHGLYNKNNCLEEEFEKYNIDLQSKRYTILILNYVKNKSVTIPIKDYLDIRNNFTSIVMEFLNTSFQGYSVEIDLENSAVIIGLNNDTDIIELMSICTSIIDFFNSQIKVIRLTIGVSSQTDNIFKISECYRNTLDIIDNRSISSLSEIVLCDLCSLKEISIGTKELKIYSIINYVMDGMYDEAASEFLNAVESLLSNEPTYAQLIKASTILHKKINGLLLSKDVSDEDIMQLEITLLSELNNIYTINEFKDRVKTYFNAIEDIFNYGSNPSMNNIAENVKAYVRQNYNDPDLYLGKIALDMNITANYISHVFKASTGMSFPEYLTMIRIEKARELLVNTQHQIKDIGYECGYTNVSTFIRSFKNTVGISPGKYRNMNA
jgi:two-component system response regulator YesN